MSYLILSKIAQSNRRDEVEDQFCFIGRLAQEKQIDHIIKAFDIYLKKVIHLSCLYMEKIKRVI